MSYSCYLVPLFFLSGWGLVFGCVSVETVQLLSFHNKRHTLWWDYRTLKSLISATTCLALKEGQGGYVARLICNLWYGLLNNLIWFHGFNYHFYTQDPDLSLPSWPFPQCKNSYFSCVNSFDYLRDHLKCCVLCESEDLVSCLSTVSSFEWST